MASLFSLMCWLSKATSDFYCFNSVHTFDVKLQNQYDLNELHANMPTETESLHMVRLKGDSSFFTSLFNHQYTGGEIGEKTPHHVGQKVSAVLIVK